MEINNAHSSVEGNYCKITEDPDVMLQYVNKYVNVRLIKKSSFTGFVHSIDPVSFSIIISVPQENKYQTILIPGHAIFDLTEIESDTNTKPPPRKTTFKICTESSRKENLIKWLKWNLLPVTEDGEKIVFGNASILPPYSVMDICTDNPMVAMQMRKIIEKMPAHFESM
ncbi:unnamed protein product [Diatraea saccharalis]|uniref:AD domain-containing protein n=1 Tax=Diatraea saccharalis TaxID=40085 RepID=A0A9N9WCG4_9NEOP|nr:unnamed protein product [Diatraea saccharalis]